MLKLLLEIARLFAREERWRIVTLVAAMILSAFAEAVGVGLLMPFVAMVGNLGVIHDNAYLAEAYRWSGASSEVGFLMLTSGALVVIFVAKNLFLGLTAYVQNRFLYFKEAALTTRLVQAYLYAPYTYHLQRNSAELVRIATTEVSRVISGVVAPVLTLLAEAFIVVMLTGLLLMAEPVVGLTVIGGVVLVGVVVQRYFRPLMVRFRDMRIVHQAAQVRWASQALGALKDVKVLRRENFFIGEVKNASNANSQANVVFATLNSMPRLVLETVAVICILGFVMAAVARGAALGPILPMLALFAMVAVRVMPSATKMMNAINVIRFFRPGLDAVLSSLDAAPKSALLLAKQRHADPVGEEARYFEQFHIRDVWYQHPGMRDWILEGVNCTIRRGDLLAVVGRSGSGKSTLADMLLGLIEPQRGGIDVDGTDILGLGDRWLRLVGYVPQHVYLLDDTIRRNVAFGIPDGEIDDALVWRALDAAHIADKVRSQPAVLDAPVGERGSHLSGGERQRLAIARALYSDPEILILDEATSALDSQTGQALMATIEELAGNKTIIFITHQLECIDHWQNVIYMEHGRVVAQGAFEQLRTRIGDWSETTDDSECGIPVDRVFVALNGGNDHVG